MTEYQYVDYNNLIDAITKGNYTINQPIMVEDNKISFLENLLNYSNVDKGNLHEILVEIINRIKKKLYQEQLNPNVQLLMNHVKGEWINDNNNDNDNNDNNLFCDHNCLNINNMNEHLNNKKDYEDLVNRLEEKFSEQKVYSKMLPETELGEYSVLGLANSMDDIKNKCSIIIQKLQKDLDLIDVEKEKIDNIDLSLLLDLSLKHINLYKEIDENNDENIDEKINNIFMNYTLVINLLKKQINHLRNIILEIKQEVLNKCGNIDELMGNVETGQKQANCENELSFF